MRTALIVLVMLWLPGVAAASDVCCAGGLTLSARHAAQPPGPPWASESWYIRRQLEMPWVLKGVHVIDVETGNVQRDVNILIQGDTIAAMGPLQPFGSIKVIDAAGMYVIPGLFDLHAHVMPKSIFFPDADPPEESLRKLLHAGVTTIRALPIYSESAHGWSASINRGVLPGPTIVPTSSILEKQAQRTSEGFGDPETAALWVRKEALLGARWVKIYNSMDEESLKTIVQTARQYGMRVCGHANQVPPHRAAALGLGTIEHAISLAYSALRDGAGKPPGRVGIRQAAWYWDHADPAKLDQLMATLRQHSTGWVPTLVVQEALVEAGGHDGGKMKPETLETLRAALGTAATLAVKHHRAGGLVATGSDFPVNGVQPGISVHREMEIMVEQGGATPLEALQMATRSAARILGYEDLLGTVAEDRLAHLVVLKENPLESIRNTRTIRYVVHDGRLIEIASQP